MADITLRVIDGADRGRVFDNLRTPVTIGREEGNSIQLNDDRVSRYHIKIQEDKNHVVLTDLESTNGTKVNGEDIQLRILRYGDMISLGRSVLIFGSRDQIARRVRELRQTNSGVPGLKKSFGEPEGSSLDFDADWAHGELPFSQPVAVPPELPEGLSPAQGAQLCEILEYIHHRLRELLVSVKPAGASCRVSLDYDAWQNLIDIQARLSEYIRAVGDPET